MKVQKTRYRKLALYSVGTITAHETLYRCFACNYTASSQELGALAPPRHTFGYDVIIYIGEAVFRHARNEQEIRNHLQNRGITISASEVALLAKKYICYLACAHRESTEALRSHMKDRGGYVLHLDGTLTAPVKQIVRICSLALNDPDSGTIHTIEARVQTFYHQLVNNDELQEVGYRKMQQQIEKYWEKLFADPVIVTRGEETLTLAPQRTNNILLPAGFHYPQDPAKPFPGRTDGGFGA